MKHQDIRDLSRIEANKSQFASNYIYDHKSYEDGFYQGMLYALDSIPSSIEVLKSHLEVNAGRLAEPILKSGSSIKDDPECHKAFLMMAHLQEIEDYLKERK